MWECRWIEHYMSYHVNPIPDIIHASLVNHYAYKEVRHLCLKTGQFFVVMSNYCFRVENKDQDGQKNLGKIQDHWLLDKALNVLVRELVAPFVLEGESEESATV